MKRADTARDDGANIIRGLLAVVTQDSLPIFSLFVKIRNLFVAILLSAVSRLANDSDSVSPH